MTDPLYNGTCRLRVPSVAGSGSDGLARTRHDDTEPAIRCSLRQLTRREEATVLGAVGMQAYILRLVTTQRPAPGWQVEVRRDGDTEWLTYTVREARQAGARRTWSLTVERA